MANSKKRAEMYEIRKRKNKAKRKRRIRKIKKILKVTTRITILVSLIVLISVLSYKGLNFLLEQNRIKAELEANKIYEVYDLQLTLGEERMVTLFLQQSNHENSNALLRVKIKLENLNFKDRKEFPQAYLKAECSDSKTICTLSDVTKATLYLKGEDISTIEIN